MGLTCHALMASKGAGPRSAVGSASDSRARGPGFDTRSGHILSFLLPLIHFVVVVVLLFYVHGKHLRSCRDGQLT